MVATGSSCVIVCALGVSRLVLDGFGSWTALSLTLAFVGSAVHVGCRGLEDLGGWFSLDVRLGGWGRRGRAAGLEPGERPQAGAGGPQAGPGRREQQVVIEISARW